MAYLNSEQIVKYKNNINTIYTNQIKYDNKSTTLATAKQSAIDKFDVKIAANTVIVDDNKELLIQMMVNYFLHTGVAFSSDYPLIWDYINLKTGGDILVVNGTTYHLSDLGRVNS